MQRARDLNLTLDGSPSRIAEMIRSGRSVDGDMYLDFHKKGNNFNRPALTAMLQRIREDLEVSTVLIPRRDRLARPDEPADGMRIENEIRRLGIRICFQEVTLDPLGVRQRPDVGEQVRALVDYTQAGKFRQELATKMLYAQRNLAEQGFSSGGRPPFFLRRWLIDPNGNPVRQLSEGEIVRQKGHHVAWLPADDETLALALRIVEMLDNLPASRITKTLTSEGIPSPDAGRMRTDNGIKHFVSGAWNVPTIVNVARSCYLIGEVVWGRRSMGDQMRYSPEGPRELTDSDLRDGGKPKVILNPEKEWTKAAAKFAALIDPARLKGILEKLDRRGASQRGRPRSKDPKNNPLGTRIFDWACGWPMYREPYMKKGQNSFRYKCGAYTQSHGATCSHNHVDGPQATRYALDVVRQRLISPSFNQKVRKHLEYLVERDRSIAGDEDKITRNRADLDRVVQDLTIAERNLARAGSDAQYAAIAKEFDRLQQSASDLRKEIAEMESVNSRATDPIDDLEHALDQFGQVAALADDAGDYEQLVRLFAMTELRMFLRFQKVRSGKRELQRIVSGVVTLGSVAPPIKLYEGKTGRHALKEAGKAATKTPRPHQCGGGDNVVSDGDGNSLGNVSRGDSIFTEQKIEFTVADLRAA